MAFAVTLRYGMSGNATTDTQWSSGTFTPTASSLLLAGYGGVSTGMGGASQHNAQTLAVATNTGGWGAHTQVIEVEPVDGPDWDSYGGQWPCAYNISRVSVPASPGSGQVSSAVTFADGDFDTSMAVIDITGHNASSPIVQAKSAQASYQDTSSGHNLNVTLDSAPTVGNLLVCFAVATCDNGGGFSTPYAGSGNTFTALHNAGGFYAQNYVGYRVAQSGDSSTVQIDDLGQTVGGGIIFVIEVAAESSASSNSGSATGSWNVSGSATGSHSASGTASGTWNVSGSATGSHTASGTAGGSWTVSGAANGSRVASGSASGSWSATGSASGVSGVLLWSDAFDYAQGDLDAVSPDWVLQGGSVETFRTLVPWNTDGNGAIYARRSLNEFPYTSYSSGALVDRAFPNDCAVELDFVVPATVNESWTIEICLRFSTEETTGYLATVFGWEPSGIEGSDYSGVALAEFPADSTNAQWKETKTFSTIAKGVTHTFRAEIVGHTLYGYLNGALHAVWTDPDTSFNSGSIGLIGYSENYDETWTTFDPPLVTDFRVLGPSVHPSGVASGSWSVSGSATGSAPSVGSSSGSASGSWSVEGSASGSHVASGSASGAWTDTGSASGSIQPSGSASGSWQTTGSATGSAPVVGESSGSASGTWSVSGSATGSTELSGSATGLWSVDGSASGSTEPRGTASGTWSSTGSATGSAPVVGAANGSASGTWTVTGSASGSTEPSGSASGSWSSSGSATGSSPAVGVSNGSATGSWSVTGSAVGSVKATGSALGLWSVSGSASGTAPALDVPSGSASGSWSTSGDATGSTVPVGSASGSWLVDGSAFGIVDASGSASGGWSYSGSAFGTTKLVTRTPRYGAVPSLTANRASPVFNNYNARRES